MLGRKNEREAEMKKKLIVVDRNACIVNQVIRNLRRAFTPSRWGAYFLFSSADVRSVLVWTVGRRVWWEKDGEGVVVGPSRVGFGASEERGMAELSVLHRFSSRKDEPQGSPANRLSSGHQLPQPGEPSFLPFLLFPPERLIVADSVAE